jgi:hypothetical protein
MICSTLKLRPHNRQLKVSSGQGRYPLCLHLFITAVTLTSRDFGMRRAPVLQERAVSILYCDRVLTVSWPWADPECVSFLGGPIHTTGIVMSHRASVCHCVWTGLSCNTPVHTLCYSGCSLQRDWPYSVNRAVSQEFEISKMLKTVVPCEQVPNLFWNFIIQTGKCTTYI